MRIQVIQKPTSDEVEGVRLDVFEPGVQYEVGNRLGALMLAERWAQPAVASDEENPGPISECQPDSPAAATAAAAAPKNLIRETYPPYYDSGTRIDTLHRLRRGREAGDRRRHPRLPGKSS